MMAMLRILSMGETNYSVKLSELRGPQYGRTRYRSQPKVTQRQTSHRGPAFAPLRRGRQTGSYIKMLDSTVLRNSRPGIAFHRQGVRTVDHAADIHIRAEVRAS